MNLKKVLDLLDENVNIITKEFKSEPQNEEDYLSYRGWIFGLCHFRAKLIEEFLDD